MRLILSALTFFLLSQSAFACASGRFESFDWADPTYAPQRKAQPEVVYFIGQVKAFYGKTDGLGKQIAGYGEAEFEVLTKYTWYEIEPTSIRVHCSGSSCGGRLVLGQIALFAFKTENGKRELLSYTYRF